MAEENDPWAAFRPKVEEPVEVVPTATPDENDPWAKFRPVQPEVNELRGDQEYPEDLDTLTNEVGQDAKILDAAAKVQEDTVVGPELYDAIDKKERYKELRDFEERYGGVFTLSDLDDDNLLGGPKIPDAVFGIDEKAGFLERNIPDVPFIIKGSPEHIKISSRERLQSLYKERENEKAEFFKKIGRQEKDPSLMDQAVTWGDYPVRKQYKMEPNVDFDPNLPEDEKNPRDNMEEYYVPPPDQDALIGIGYRIARNLAGLVDMGYDAVVNQELNLSEEGVVRSQMPQLPQRSTEKFIADLTSYALGPELALGTVAKGGKTAVELGGLAARTAKYISPETMTKARDVYKAAIANGASVAEATESSRKFMKRVLVGTAIGLSEAAIADDNSEGLVDPKTIQEITGWNARDAHDMSLFLDSPVISGTIRLLGGAYKTGAGITENAFGGVRTTKAGSRLEMSQTEAGFRILKEIDPNIMDDGPEMAVYRVKVLQDILLQEGMSSLELAGTKVEAKNDLGVAVIRSAQKYFRQAYEFKADTMSPKEFADWTAQNGAEAANRITSLKTALASDDGVKSIIGKAQGTTELLLDDAARNSVDGTVAGAQSETASILAKIRTKDSLNMKDDLEAATYQRDIAKENYEHGFIYTPSIQDQMMRARTDFELGAHDKINDKFVNDVLGTKVYSSFKKMYNEKNDAFKKLQQYDVQADVPAFLEKLKEVGFKSSDEVDVAEDALDQVPASSLEDRLRRETEEFLKKKKGDTELSSPEVDAKLQASDPIFKEIGDMVVGNGKYSNLLVNVHNRIQTKIKQLSKSPSSRDQDLRDRLQELDDHIFEEQSKLVDVPPEFKKDFDEAHEKFISYKTSWEQLDPMKQVAQKGKDRANAENAQLQKGNTLEGQGASEWKRTVSQLWEAERSKPDGQFVDNLLRASEAGGQPIRNEVADVIEMNIFRDFDNHRIKGKQDVAAFRGTIRNYIDTLKLVDPKRAARYVEMETNLVNLEKKYKDSNQRVVELEKLYNQAETDWNNSVASRFYTSRDTLSGAKSGVFDPTADPGTAMSKLFDSTNSTDELRQLMSDASKLEGKKGEVIIQAIRGSYWNHIKNKVFGNVEAEFTATPAGVKASRNVTSKGLRLTEDPKIAANIKLLYGEKELQNFKQVEQWINDSTKTFDRGKLVSLQPPPSQDAQKGVTSVITAFLGVLNPKATMAKRLAGPWAQLSAEQLEEGKKRFLVAALADIPTAVQLMKRRPEQLLKSLENEEFVRFASRAYLNTEFKEKNRDFSAPRFSPVDKINESTKNTWMNEESEKIRKVPPGLK